MTASAVQTVLHHVLSMPADQSEALFGLLVVGKQQHQLTVTPGKTEIIQSPHQLAPPSLTPNRTAPPDELIGQLQRMPQFKDRLLPAPANNNAKPKGD